VPASGVGERGPRLGPRAQVFLALMRAKIGNGLLRKKNTKYLLVFLASVEISDAVHIHSFLGLKFSLNTFRLNISVIFCTVNV